MLRIILFALIVSTALAGSCFIAGNEECKINCPSVLEAICQYFQPEVKDSSSCDDTHEQFEYCDYEKTCQRPEDVNNKQCEAGYFCEPGYVKINQTDECNRPVYCPKEREM